MANQGMAQATVSVKIARLPLKCNDPNRGDNRHGPMCIYTKLTYTISFHLTQKYSKLNTLTVAQTIPQLVILSHA